MLSIIKTKAVSKAIMEIMKDEVKLLVYLPENSHFLISSGCVGWTHERIRARTMCVWRGVDSRAVIGQ
jgi:hypothetical protein